MTATLAEPPPARTPPQGPPGWLLLPPLLLVAVYVIFAHGCHAGDHDDELSAVRAEAPPPSAARP